MLILYSSNLLGQAPDIMDIAPPVEMPRPVSWIWWVVGFTAGAAVVFFLTRSRRDADQKAFVDAHDIALRDLDALAAELVGEAAADKDTRVLFTRLELVLREYLYRRFDINSPPVMVRDVAECLSRRQMMTPGQFATISGVLAVCELVRFGEKRPPDSVVRDTLAAARAWVEQTRLRLAGPSAASLMLNPATRSARHAAH